MAKKKCACQKNKAKVGVTKEDNSLYWFAGALVLGLGGYYLWSNRNAGANVDTQDPTIPPTPPNPQLPPAGGSSGGGSSPALPLEYTKAIKDANAATVKAVQTLMNKIFDYLRSKGTVSAMWWDGINVQNPPIPANLVVDGVFGTNTKNALKHLVVWIANLQMPTNTPQASRNALSNVNELVFTQNCAQIATMGKTMFYQLSQYTFPDYSDAINYLNIVIANNRLLG